MLIIKPLTLQGEAEPRSHHEASSTAYLRKVERRAPDRSDSDADSTCVFYLPEASVGKLHDIRFTKIHLSILKTRMPPANHINTLAK